MEKDKSRGIKHIKDKKKYKGNSTKDPKHVPPKINPIMKLESNWDRYEVNEETEPKLSSSTDFALLSNAHISCGSHFQFKSDKINEETIDPQDNDLFVLNLDLLHRSVQTIPFYDILGIETRYFKENEIEQMIEKAAENLDSYEKYLHSISPSLPADGISREESESPTKPNIPEFENIPCIEKEENMLNAGENKDSIIDLIIERCTLEEENEQEEDMTGPVSKESNVELEQWLDDILED